MEKLNKTTERKEKERDKQEEEKGAVPNYL
jgi:hypothetical protein